MNEEPNYDELDPGIRDIVRKIRAEGFSTTDSGDGVSKPPAEDVLPFPHVVVKAEPDSMIQNAEFLAAILGPDYWVVEATYSTKDHSAILLARKEQE